MISGHLPNIYQTFTKHLPNIYQTFTKHLPTPVGNGAEQQLGQHLGDHGMEWGCNCPELNKKICVTSRVSNLHIHRSN